MRKMRKDDARNILVRYLQGRYPHIKQPCKFKIKVIAQQQGHTLLPVLVDEKTRTVRLLNDTALTAMFTDTAEYIWTIADQTGQFSNYDALNMASSTIQDAVKIWQHSESSLLKEEVKVFCFKSDPCYAFSRCGFDILDTWQESPTFDQLMANFSNSKGVMAFIGSIFFEQSYNQQYVWIHGEGGNGKGAFIRAIQNVFGAAFYSSTYVPTKDDKHWTHELIGKRLVVFPDCNDVTFVTSGLFKSLTGSDVIRVEQKFKDAYNVNINAKFMFHSNKLPKISSSESDKRRLILSESKNDKAFVPDRNFEEQLKKETPNFISNCIFLYKVACPNFGIIPNDRSGVDLLAIQNEEVIYAFIEKYFEAGDGYLTPSATVHELLQKYGKHIYQPQFFKILKRDFLAESGPHRYEGKVVRCYSNIKPSRFAY